MPQSYVAPDILYAWRGQSLLVLTNRGAAGDEHTLTGFYFREARHLRTLRLRLHGAAPWLTEAAVERPDVLRFDYVHPELHTFGGGGSGQSGDEVKTDEHGIPYRALDLRVRHTVGIAGLDVSIEIANRAQRSVTVELSIDLDADFADIQEAQGARRQQSAPVNLRGADGYVSFQYAHATLAYRTRVTGGGEAEWRANGSALSTTLTLGTQQLARLTIAVAPDDSADPMDLPELAQRDAHWRRWRETLTRVETPGNSVAEALIASNIEDLASFPLLQGNPDEWLTMQAGMPVYPALFGRDTMTAGWQAAFLDRGAVLDASLIRLGRLQSDRDDEWRDEEPGRIPYQVRQGPLARLNINPYAAYYADFASPLMYVISLAHLYSWTGERASLERHWDTARRILDWARDYGDRDGDGYLEYFTRSPEGTKNQGWKDSGDAIVYEDGTPVPSPLGTCELQGYWFAAQQLFAVMSWVMGARDDAKAYWQSAMDLKARFNRDWWMPDDGCVALALDADKRYVRACTSNAGHCIAAGIVSDGHLPALVGRLFAPDMFSGWGVRTLSAAHVAYDPVSYHLGSVWSVENATIVFGLRRFGFDTRAAELARAMFDLAALYPDFRIPECVGGYARADGSSPGAYARANTPQLWNASGIALVLHSLLGLQPVAPLNLLAVDPVLPTWLPEVILRDLRIGGATATIRFWRDGDGDSHAEVVRQRGTLHLVKQPPLESLAAGARDRMGALIDGIWHR